MLASSDLKYTVYGVSCPLQEMERITFPVLGSGGLHDGSGCTHG